MLIFLFAIEFCVYYNIFSNDRFRLTLENKILKLAFFQEFFSFCRFSRHILIQKIIKFTFLILISLKFTSISYFLRKIISCEKDINLIFGLLLFWSFTANPKSQTRTPNEEPGYPFFRYVFKLLTILYYTSMCSSKNEAASYINYYPLTRKIISDSDNFSAL